VSDRRIKNVGTFEFNRVHIPFPEEEKMSDNVNHPKHYTSLGAKCSGCEKEIECIDVIEQMLPNLANAVKYIWRAPFKGNLAEDLQKAIWYLNRELKRINKPVSYTIKNNDDTAIVKCEITAKEDTASMREEHAFPGLLFCQLNDATNVCIHCAKMLSCNTQRICQERLKKARREMA